MAESITCICGYRGPSVPEAGREVCPICRGRVRGSSAAWPGEEAAESGVAAVAPASERGPPAEPVIYRIPCPNGHVLKAREEMLGQQVCCPQCNDFFVLRATDSVEYRRQQERLRSEAEAQAAQAWLKRAIWAAVIIGLSFIAMLVIGLNPSLVRR